MIATKIAHKLLPSLTFVLSATFAVESARAQATEGLRGRVLGAWESRQNSVESATFRIRSTFVLTENELQRVEHRRQKLQGTEPNPEELPQGDTVLIELYEIAFDGDKLRYFMTFDESTHERAKSVNRNMRLLYVTDGTDYRALESFPDHGTETGIIENADQFAAFRDEAVAPVIQAFRAFTHHNQLINNLELVEGDHEIDGRSVVVMQQHPEGIMSAGVQYWTDPLREHVILRRRLMSGGDQVGSQTDIKYEQHKSGNWVPVKWSRTDLAPNGDLRRSYDFEVVEYEINPRLPKSLFELEFAPGVKVFDNRKGASRANIWTVNKDGTKNMMQGFDPDKSDDFAGPRRVLLWINGVIVLLLAIYLVRRRMQTVL